MQRFFKTFLVLAVVTGSCVSHDLSEVQTSCPTTPISYSNEVRTIINERCAIPTCHNGSNGADKNWTNFNTLKQRSTNVKTRVVNRTMPPSSQPGLTQEQINIISCWVDQGAQNN